MFIAGGNSEQTWEELGVGDGQAKGRVLILPSRQEENTERELD